MALRARLVLALLGLALGACASFGGGAPPLPEQGPILYSCSDGTQLTAEFAPDEARVAIVGGYSMVLARTGAPDAPSYSNGRYSISGGGREATWRAQNRAPVTCRGN